MQQGLVWQMAFINLSHTEGNKDLSSKKREELPTLAIDDSLDFPEMLDGRSQKPLHPNIPADLSGKR